MVGLTPSVAGGYTILFSKELLSSAEKRTVSRDKVAWKEPALSVPNCRGVDSVWRVVVSCRPVSLPIKPGNAAPSLDKKDNVAEAYTRKVGDNAPSNINHHCLKYNKDISHCFFLIFPHEYILSHSDTNWIIRIRLRPSLTIKRV